jgi:hypothetical protein
MADEFGWDTVEGVEFSAQDVSVTISAVKVTMKVGVAKMRPGGYTERRGHGRAHVLQNLSDQPARVRRTTTRPGSEPRVEDLELLRDQPLWIEATPPDVTVRVENISIHDIIVGKRWPR